MLVIEEKLKYPPSLLCSKDGSSALLIQNVEYDVAAAPENRRYHSYLEFRKMKQTRPVTKEHHKTIFEAQDWFERLKTRGTEPPNPGP